uniref:FunU4 n=1 Tax=Streptosporangium sp. KD35 TaxID=2162663 RepID=A0A2U9KCU6_9ACTN|nr:FunU4 [Streptosporangium sp. KD35]
MRGLPGHRPMIGRRARGALRFGGIHVAGSSGWGNAPSGSLSGGPDPSGGAGHRAAGAVGARVSGVLVLLAPPAGGTGRGRIPGGGGGRARIRPFVQAGWGGGLPDAGTGRGQRRGGARPRRGDRDHHRSRLGFEHRRRQRPGPAGGVHRGRAAERPLRAAGRAPAQRGLRPDGRRGGVLRQLLPAARPGRGRDRTGRPRLAGRVLRRALRRHDARPRHARPSFHHPRRHAPREVPHRPAAVLARPGRPGRLRRRVRTHRHERGTQPLSEHGPGLGRPRSVGRGPHHSTVGVHRRRPGRLHHLDERRDRRLPRHSARTRLLSSPRRLRPLDPARTRPRGQPDPDRLARLPARLNHSAARPCRMPELMTLPDDARSAVSAWPSRAGSEVWWVPGPGWLDAGRELWSWRRAPVRRSWRTATDDSTSAPPASCTGVRDSPRMSAASAAVTTGSKVDRMAAFDGPVRLSPAKKVSIATTVETTAMQASQSHPDTPKPRSTPPVSRARAPRVPAAPVITSADSTTGASRCTTVSATRM